MDARFPKRHQCAKVEMLLNHQKEGAFEMKITTIGLDLAEYIFQLHGVDERGKPAARRAIKRDDMLALPTLSSA
jgi:hypothetical protein